MSLAGLLQAGQVLADRGKALVAYQCTACMACTEYCEHSIDVASALLDTRRTLIKKGVISREKSIFMEDSQDLLQRLRKGFPVTWFEPGLQGLLIPGSAMLRGPFTKMHAMAGLLSGLRIQYLEIAEISAEPTGYDLYAAGFDDDFQAMAKAMYARLRRYKIVVTPSPVVEYTLKFLYTLFDIGSGPRIRSLTEVILPLVLAEKHNRPLNARLVFHDCSFAGRYMGRYEQPREILNHISNMKPLELRRSRQNAMSCGIGGSFNKMFPDEAELAALEVVRMAKDTGAEYLVTESPECYELFTRVVRKCGGIRVRLLFDFVYQWLKQNR